MKLWNYNVSIGLTLNCWLLLMKKLRRGKDWLASQRPRLKWSFLVRFLCAMCFNWACSFVSESSLIQSGFLQNCLTSLWPSIPGSLTSPLPLSFLKSWAHWDKTRKMELICSVANYFKERKGVKSHLPPLYLYYFSKISIFKGSGHLLC